MSFKASSNNSFSSSAADALAFTFPLAEAVAVLAVAVLVVDWAVVVVFLELLAVFLAGFSFFFVCSCSFHSNSIFLISLKVTTPYYNFFTTF